MTEKMHWNREYTDVEGIERGFLKRQDNEIENRLKIEDERHPFVHQSEST